MDNPYSVEEIAVIRDVVGRELRATPGDSGLQELLDKLGMSGMTPDNLRTIQSILLRQQSLWEEFPEDCQTLIRARDTTEQTLSAADATAGMRL